MLFDVLRQGSVILGFNTVGQYTIKPWGLFATERVVGPARSKCSSELVLGIE